MLTVQLNFLDVIIVPNVKKWELQQVLLEAHWGTNHCAPCSGMSSGQES